MQSSTPSMQSSTSSMKSSTPSMQLSTSSMQSSEKFATNLKTNDFSVCTDDNFQEVKKFVVKLKSRTPMTSLLFSSQDQNKDNPPVEPLHCGRDSLLKPDVFFKGYSTGTMLPVCTDDNFQEVKKYVVKLKSGTPMTSLFITSQNQNKDTMPFDPLHCAQNKHEDSSQIIPSTNSKRKKTGAMGVSAKRKANFKHFIYKQIISKVSVQDPYSESQTPCDCTVWLGPKKKYKRYSEAYHIVRLKNDIRHYISPQKYIYNYLNFPDAEYAQLINMKNRVRNIDNCLNRGLCCCVAHLEAY